MFHRLPKMIALPRLVLHTALVLGLALPAMAAPAAPADPITPFLKLKGTLHIAGGTAHIPVMREAARQIMSRNADIRITIAGGGSGVGVEQAGAGLAHIGNTGRPLKDAEIQRYGLVSFPFAIDGVAAVVHPDNKVGALTLAQLKEVMAGRVTNWKDLGGKDAPINLYTREDGSGTREVFVEKGLGKGAIAASANVVNSNGAMKTAVSKDVNALGYVSIGHLDAKLRPLTLDGKAPTQKNAQDITYPVVRKLYMNTKGQPEGLTRAFVDYVLSPAAEEIILKSGYLPLPR